MMAARSRPAEPIRDFGPELRLKEARKPGKGGGPVKLPTGEAARRRRAAAAIKPDPLRVTVKENRPDPATVTGLVRGARVRDPLRKMWEARYITKRQWQGAEAFRDDVALAAGARLDQADDAGVRSFYTNRNWPTETQLKAMDRVTKTMGHLSEQQKLLVSWSLIEHRPLTDFIREQGMRTEDGGAMLRVLLDYIALYHRPAENLL